MVTYLCVPRQPALLSEAGHEGRFHPFRTKHSRGSNTNCPHQYPIQVPLFRGSTDAKVIANNVFCLKEVFEYGLGLVLVGIDVLSSRSVAMEARETVHRSRVLEILEATFFNLIFFCMTSHISDLHQMVFVQQVAAWDASVYLNILRWREQHEVGLFLAVQWILLQKANLAGGCSRYHGF